MRIAGNRPSTERAEQQYDQVQVARESYQQTVVEPLHHVPEPKELAGTTFSVDRARATSMG